MSLEHDGSPLLNPGGADPAKLLSFLQPKVQLPIAIKAYPRDLVAYANRVHPQHAWSPSRLRTTSDELATAWKITRQALIDGIAACKLRNSAFGAVLASKIEGHVVIPSYAPGMVEEFDHDGRFWKVYKKDKDELHKLARGHMHIFGTVTYQHRHGYLQPVRAPIPPDPLLQISFMGPIAGDAVLHLHSVIRPLDDPEHVRHTILFSCGTLYNYKTKTFRRGMPEDYVLVCRICFLSVCIVGGLDMYLFWHYTFEYDT